MAFFTEEVFNEFSWTSTWLVEDFRKEDLRRQNRILNQCQKKQAVQSKEELERPREQNSTNQQQQQRQALYLNKKQWRCENAPLLPTVPIRKAIASKLKYDHPGSWYRIDNPCYSKLLHDSNYHQWRFTEVGAATQDKFLLLHPKLANRPPPPSSSHMSPAEARERDEYNTIVAKAAVEQEKYLKFQEGVALTRRRHLYTQFCPLIPPMYNVRLHEWARQQVAGLPPIYLYEAEFDTKQVIFKAADVLQFMLMRQVVAGEYTQPTEAPLCEASFQRIPVPIDKAMPPFMEGRLSACEHVTGTWAGREDRREWLRDVTTSETCILDLDTLALIASSSFGCEFDFTIPFTRQRGTTPDSTICEFGLPLFSHGYPVRLHSAGFVQRFLSEKYRDLGVKQANCVVNLFKLGDSLSLLIGTNDVLYWCETPPASQKPHSNLQFYLVKMEMQPEFGVEHFSSAEMAKIWILLSLFPGCRVSVVRVDYGCQALLEVIDFEETRLSALANLKKPNLQLCAHLIQQLLTKCCRLKKDGKYLLRRAAFATKIEIFIQSSLSDAPDKSAMRPYNLKLAVNEPITPSDAVSYLPIDTSRILPFHYLKKRIPGTFPFDIGLKHMKEDGIDPNDVPPAEKKKKKNKPPKRKAEMQN